MTDTGHRRTGGGWIAVGAVAGAMSVIIGAFAAHGLDAQTAAKEIGWLHTGSLYQALHGLAILAVAGLTATGQLRPGLAKTAQWFFLVGVVIFPAALYGLAFHGPRWLGAIAPVGGSSFILGWVTLTAAALLTRETAGVRR
jgi:uncharacterized membrane protein YgdD (TMEM256/DUF423 family)